MSYVSTLRINLQKASGSDGNGHSEGAKERPAPVAENGAQGSRVRRPEHPAFSRPLWDGSVPDGSDLTLEGHVTGTPPISVSWLHNDMARVCQSRSSQVSRVTVTSKVTSVSSASVVSHVTVAPNGTTELEKGAVTMLFKVHPQHSITREVCITELRGSSPAVADREKTCHSMTSKRTSPATLRTSGTTERILTPLGTARAQEIIIAENDIPDSVLTPASKGTERPRNVIRSEITVAANHCATEKADRILTPSVDVHAQECRKAGDSAKEVSVSFPSPASGAPEKGRTRNAIRAEITVAANHRATQKAERILAPLAAAHPQDYSSASTSDKGVTLSMPSPSSANPAASRERIQNAPRTDVIVAANNRVTDQEGGVVAPLPAVHPQDCSKAGRSEKDVAISAPSTASSGHAVLRERPHNAPHTDVAVAANSRLTDQDGGVLAPLAAVHSHADKDVAISVPPAAKSGHASRRDRTLNTHHKGGTGATSSRVSDQKDGILATLPAVHPQDRRTAGLSDKDDAVSAPSTVSSSHASRRERTHNATITDRTVTANNRVTDQGDVIPALLPAVHLQDRGTTGLTDKDVAVSVASTASPGHAARIERTHNTPNTDRTVTADNRVTDQREVIPALLTPDHGTTGLADKEVAVSVASTASSGHGRAKKLKVLQLEMTVADNNRSQDLAETILAPRAALHPEDGNDADLSGKGGTDSMPSPASLATDRDTTGDVLPSAVTVPGMVCATETAEPILTSPAAFHGQDDSNADISEHDILDFLPCPPSPGASPDSVTPKRRALKSGSGDSLRLVDPVNCVEVKAGEQAELHCGIVGTPPIAASWVKQKKQISNGPKTTVETTDTGSTLVIQDVQGDDSGCYMLFVRDRTGSTQHQMSLSVIDRPQPPSGKPYTSALRAESLTLSWSGPCYDGGSAVQSYVVEVKGVGEQAWRTLTDSCLSTSYRVKGGLEPEREYQFRVLAVNAHGVSEPSEESTVIKMSTEEDASSTEPFEYRQVVISTTEKVSDLYTQLEKLGVGKFGQVFKLQEKASGKILAGKFYKTRTAKEKENARMEVELMNKLHHPKLAQCVAAYQTRAEMVMVLEYIAGGELFERIVDDSFEHTEPTCVQYMRQILEGVQYMHSQNIVHLDLKPENIVCVNKTGNYIKIIDFGLARMLDLKTQVKVMQGTAEFIAPEVIGFEAIGYTTDMWSIGVICYILLSGDSPFQGNNDMETLRNITAAQWEFDEETFEEISDRAKDFISKLLQKNMRSRLTADQALEHPWLKELDQGSTKTLSKEKIKKFLARQKWQKTGKAVLALKRMSLLSNRQDSKVTSPDSPQRDDIGSCSPQDSEVLSLLNQQIQRPPSFSKPLKDQVEVEGSSACLQCHIEGYPDPEVIWFQNDIPIQEAGRFRIDYDETGSCSLIVSDVTQGDSGQYACKAFNDVGEAEISAKLTVCPLHGVRNR